MRLASIFHAMIAILILAIPNASAQERSIDERISNNVERIRSHIENQLVQCRRAISLRDNHRDKCLPTSELGNLSGADRYYIADLGGDRRLLAIAARECLRGAIEIRQRIDAVNRRGERNEYSNLILFAQARFQNIVMAGLAGTVRRCNKTTPLYCPSFEFWQSNIGARIRSERRFNSIYGSGQELQDSRTLWNRCGRNVPEDPMMACNCEDRITGRVYQRLGTMRRSQCRRQIRRRCDPIITCECREDFGKGRLVRSWRSRRSQCVSGRPC